MEDLLKWTQRKDVQLVNRDLAAEMEIRNMNRYNQTLNTVLGRDNAIRDQRIVSRMNEIELHKLPPFIGIDDLMISKEIDNIIRKELVHPMAAGALYSRIGELQSDVERAKYELGRGGNVMGDYMHEYEGSGRRKRKRQVTRRRR